jgi:hypothetical protein
VKIPSGAELVRLIEQDRRNLMGEEEKTVSPRKLRAHSPLGPMSIPDSTMSTTSTPSFFVGRGPIRAGVNAPQSPAKTHKSVGQFEGLRRRERLLPLY